MGDYFPVDWQQLGYILFILFLLSSIYAYFINRYIDQLQGYISLVVVAGVAVTLAAAAIFIREAVVIVLICFSASGIPMIIGDIIRYISKRERVKKFQRAIVEANEDQINHLLNELNHHDQT